MTATGHSASTVMPRAFQVAIFSLFATGCGLAKHDLIGPCGSGSPVNTVIRCANPSFARHLPGRVGITEIIIVAVTHALALILAHDLPKMPRLRTANVHRASRAARQCSTTMDLG